VSSDDPYGGQHPRDRAIEPEDPMLLTAEPVDGDPLVMLDSLIEEYAGLGWDGPHIRRIFDTPFFQATWGLARLFGPEFIAARIDAVLQRRGSMRFRTTHAPVAADGAADVPDILNCAPPGATPLRDPGDEGGPDA
jgi:hypothetical protein